MALAERYHAAMVHFLYEGWACPERQGATCENIAQVQLDGRKVQAATLVERCADDVVVTAAEAHLGVLVGREVPPPPEEAPQLLPTGFKLLFVCKGTDSSQ